LAKRKYTYEDWVEGRFCYERDTDLPIPDGRQHFFNLSPDNQSDAAFEYHSDELNDPELIYEWGDIDESELKRIRNEQRRLFKLIVDEHVEYQRPALIRNAEAIKGNDQVTQARLKQIEERQAVHPNILINLRQGKYPILGRVSGPEYKKLVDSRSAKLSYLAQNPETELQRYITMALLDVERTQLKKGLRDLLTPNAIFKRYHELRKQGFTEKAAYIEVERWVMVENGYSAKESKKAFNITFEQDSFTRNARNHPF
jgi:hypothetical protein